MERELPTYEIHGVEFLVDVDRLELREKYDPFNKIPFSLMEDLGDGYAFGFCGQSKNISAEWFFDLTDSDTVIPELKTLDPLGMAIKYNLPVEQVKKMSDLQIMVDQKSYDSRITKNILPTIDLAGNIYTIDLAKDLLRSTDSSKIIRFQDIRPYCNIEEYQYVIPFNVSTNEFTPINYDKLTTFPKDTVLLTIPFESDLDLIAWNISASLPYSSDIKFRGIKTYHKAGVKSLDVNVIANIIQKNLKKIKWEQKVSESVRLKNRKNKNNGFKL